MIEFEFSERFQHPPGRIMDALTDLDRLEEWLPDLKRVQRLDDGPYGVGSTWKETRHLFGIDATEHVEVAAYEPPALPPEQETARGRPGSV